MIVPGSEVERGGRAPVGARPPRRSPAAEDEGELRPLIELDNLHFRYGGAEADALSGIDLSVDEGEFVAVVGANGSGKSTLAKLLGGLEKATGGRRLRRVRTGPAHVRGPLRGAPRRGRALPEPGEPDRGCQRRGGPGLRPGEPRPAAEPHRRARGRDARAVRPHGAAAVASRTCSPAARSSAPPWPACWPSRAARSCSTSPRPCSTPTAAQEVLAAVARQHADGLTIVLVTQEMDEVLPADRVVALEHGTVAFDGQPHGALRAERTCWQRLSLGPAHGGRGRSGLGGSWAAPRSLAADVSTSWSREARTARPHREPERSSANI